MVPSASFYELLAGSGPAILLSVDSKTGDSDSGEDKMDIVLVRVDSRLIHGQILEAWLPYVNASCIVVVDDQVAGDLFRETIMCMAVPREVEVIISGVDNFVRHYSCSTGRGKRAIVLFSSIRDALKAFHAGFKFAKLNLGNVHDEQSEKTHTSCSSCVFLNGSDITNITDLVQAAGVHVELQRIPMERPVDARDIMPNVGFC